MSTYTYNLIEVDWDKCPISVRRSLQRYYEDHVSVGDFLTAVLSNDLMKALTRADHVNRHCLFEICRFIHNALPMGSYGTPEKVKAWVTYE